MKNDYRLIRFYAKAEEPFRLSGDLKLLVCKGLIEVTNPGESVRVFKVTTSGKAVLLKFYLLSEMEPYVLAIEKSGFFLQILQRVDENEKAN